MASSRRNARPTAGRDHLKSLRKSRRDRRQTGVSRGTSYDPSAKPDWEKIRSGGMINVGPYVRDTLGLRGRDRGKVMRAYNQQYRREQIQDFVDPELLKSYGLYNPYAPNNPGGGPRLAGLI